MIILHAGAQDGQLLLWGEASVESSPESSTVSGRRRRAGRKPGRQRQASPFDAGAAGLIGALGEVVAGLAVKAGDLHEAVIWLPTAGNQPVASSPLIAAPPPAKAKTQLAPWTVTVLPLTSAEASDLLAMSVGKKMLAPGIAVGGDLAYWARVMQWSAALVARGRFLPAVVPIDNWYYARWTPALVGDETETMARLASAMPSACRAIGAAGEEDGEDVGGEVDEIAPARASRAVLGDIVDAFVDYLARSAASDEAGRRSGSASSLHDRWLRALGGDDGRLKGGRDELARLAAEVRDWRRPVEATAAAPFRLCFRLEEPVHLDELPVVAARSRRRAPGDESWTVRYLLQAIDDPSLIVPAAEAWEAKGKSRRSKLLRRGGFDPRSYLLAALGQAAALVPQVEESLKTTAPDGYRLGAEGAHEFLRERALLLEGAGFKVMLPSWWSRQGTKLRLSARAQATSPVMKAKGRLSLDQIVDVRWELALGDEALSPGELSELARLKTPLVRLRGQWVELNAAEIRAAIDFWNKKGSERIAARDLLRMALGVGNAPGGLPVEGVAATGWFGDLLAQLEGHSSFEELTPPEGFRGELRPYQSRGYSWLAFLRRWGLGACLADDMGLGKTVQTLALIERERRAGERRPVLLICPTSVVGNWQKEARRFTPDLPVLVHHGLGRAKGAALKKAAGKQAIVVSSYALLHRDLAAFEKIDWAGVILDEAQNIKNAETKQSRAARAIAGGYRIALTGTPVENNVGDLWSIMEFLNPGMLGSAAEFKRSFFVPIQVRRDADAATKLKRLTGPFILRRLKTDRTIISDLPEKMEMKVYCTLTREQASLYAAVVRDLEEELEDAEGIQRKGLVLSTLVKLKQVCNHPAQLLGDNSALRGRSGKLARLAEMLEEALSEGDRALVFTQFAEMGGMLKRHLEEQFGREVPFLYGGTPKRRRDEMVEEFQSNEGPPIFILSLKAGGTGLNLTAASRVFHFDRWWNPAVENQATDRAFRIGQRRRVQVHKFLCAGTVEEKIDEMIESKQDVAARVVGTGEAWLTELSNDALRDLFMLRREAVAED